MIDQLLIDLAKSQEGSWLYWVIFFVGLATAIGGVIIATIFWNPNQVNHGNHLMIMGGIIITISFVFIFHSGAITGEIRGEIKDIHLDNVKKMTCDELRLLNLSIIERQHEPYRQPYDYERQLHDWQEDYYHTKCEIPLREEVMKLQ